MERHCGPANNRDSPHDTRRANRIYDSPMNKHQCSVRLEGYPVIFRHVSSLPIQAGFDPAAIDFITQAVSDKFRAEQSSSGGISRHCFGSPSFPAILFLRRTAGGSTLLQLWTTVHLPNFQLAEIASKYPLFSLDQRATVSLTLELQK